MFRTLKKKDRFVEAINHQYRQQQPSLRLRDQNPSFISRLRDETGSVTAEYVIATLAAVSFAGLLVVIMRGDEVRTILVDMVRNSLQFPG